MDAEIAKAQESLAARRERAPELRAEADAIVLPEGRHMYRRRVHLQLRAAELRSQAAYLESNALEEDLARKAEAYTRAEKNLQRVHNRKMSRFGVIETETDRHGALVQEFRADMGLQAPHAEVVAHEDTCPMCRKSLVLVQLKALLTCPECGYATPHIDATTSNIAYNNEDSYDFSTFHYKRITHFDECLKQLQAKEHAVVDDSIVHDVMGQLAHKHIPPEIVTHVHVRDALRALKCRKAYEHVAQITSRITGKPPPRIDERTEERCRTMFLCMQPFFERHCPSDRKNFLSYTYCIYKIFQLLRLDEHLDAFSLLKGKEKLERMDDIFRKICGELGWPFLPS